MLRKTKTTPHKFEMFKFEWASFKIFTPRIWGFYRFEIHEMANHLALLVAQKPLRHIEWVVVIFGIYFSFLFLIVTFNSMNQIKGTQFAWLNLSLMGSQKPWLARAHGTISAVESIAFESRTGPTGWPKVFRIRWWEQLAWPAGCRIWKKKWFPGH